MVSNFCLNFSGSLVAATASCLSSIIPGYSWQKLSICSGVHCSGLATRRIAKVKKFLVHLCLRHCIDPLPDLVPCLHLGRDLQAVLGNDLPPARVDHAALVRPIDNGIRQFERPDRELEPPQHDQVAGLAEMPADVLLVTSAGLTTSGSTCTSTFSTPALLLGSSRSRLKRRPHRFQGYVAAKPTPLIIRFLMLSGVLCRSCPMH